MNKTQQEQLYDRCISEGISLTNINEEFYKQKIKLIASSMGISIDEDPSDIFNDVISRRNQEKKEASEAEKKKKQEEQLANEIEQKKKLSKYSNLYGVEKPIAILTDIYDEKLQAQQKLLDNAQGDVNKYNEYTDVAYRYNKLMRGKERDWAIAGGIAQGIAGPAAGLASALDAQSYNASVRASNAALDRQTAQQVVQIAQLKGKAQSQVSSIKARIDAITKEKNEKLQTIRTKVVGEQNDEEAFSYVVIDKLNGTVTSTGAVIVTLEAHKNTECNVFGNHKAHVDGSFVGKIFQNGYLIGAADLVCPFDGITVQKTTINGICLCDADPSIPCVVKLTAKNLWVMED